MSRSPERLAAPLPPLLSLCAALALVGLYLLACRSDTPDSPVDSGGGAEAARDEATQVEAPRATPIQGYEVIARYPHDVDAYTQGLLIVDGQLYESTGQYGESTLRRVEIETGRVERRRPLDRTLFAEGLASSGGLLVQLTWKRGTALVWDRASLRKLDYVYSYEGEGWGLTTRDDGLFVMSDGTSRLRIIEPKGFEVVETIDVTDQGRPVLELNELEWVDGEIWANVWKSNRIARIDPGTGEVRAWVDLTGILAPDRVRDTTDEVLNGIAYDRATESLYVTGKRWPKLFQIRVVEEGK